MLVGGFQEDLEKSRSLAFNQAVGMSHYMNSHHGLPATLNPAVAAALNNAQVAAQKQEVRVSPALSNRSSEESVESSGIPLSMVSRVLAVPKQRRSARDMSNPESTQLQDFSCPVCHVTLPCQRDFTAHIRSHNEVKPKTDPDDPTGQAKVYYCCLCGKMLSSFSSLDRHMLVHSGERPFACHLCGQTFTTNGNMHRHSRTHGNRDSHESESSGSSSGIAKKGRKRKASTERPASLLSRASDPSSPLATSEPIRPHSASIQQQQQEGIRCPFCQHVVANDLILDAHANEVHTTEMSCHECHLTFSKYHQYKLHGILSHGKLDGFTDMMFMARFRGMLAEQMKASAAPPAIPPPPAAAAPPAVTKMPSPPVKKEDKILDLSTPSQAKSEESDDKVQVEDLDNTIDEYEEELRDMKLKGEFPCRLCTAVYPNLRALKGHNKEHMTRAPYVCNVGNCTYFSNDKSTLARHMRTHTGEKPFECTICSFGFTTKANCERHVKNKHGKNTREEVIDSILVHESDESSINGNLNLSLADSNQSTEPLSSPKKPRIEGTEKVEVPKEKSGKKTNTLFAPYHNSLYRTAESDKTSEKPSPAEGEAKIGEPLDLSQRLMDGGMMNSLKTSEPTSASIPTLNALYKLQSLANNAGLGRQGGGEMKSHSTATVPMAFPLAAGGPGILPPFLPHLTAPGQFEVAPFQHWLAQQELLRRQQVASAARDPTAFLQYLSNLQSLSLGGGHIPPTITPSSSSLGATAPPSSNPVCPPPPPDNQKGGQSDNRSDSESEHYKVVIKNGILMKKKKQLRYRQERPHSCTMCPKRFTLKSNMDRHLKNQHGEARLQGAGGAGGNKAMDLTQIEELAAKVTAKPFSSFFDATSGDEDDERGEEVAAAASGPPSSIKCPCCELTFPWLHLLRKHILLTHTGGNKPSKCPGCCLWFTCKDTREEHLLRHHSDHQFRSGDIPFSSSSHLIRLRKEEDLTSNEGDVDEGEIDVDGNDNEVPDVTSLANESPYKCHVCDDGFNDRETAIRHLQISHPTDYQVLVEKGAFEVMSSPPHPTGLSSSPTDIAADSDNYDNLRGKFPDYVNRKIVCLFCMRKFWSAEDLRRHVRTHTGERPYACDVCNRKFTLKHSMLRHKKKHEYRMDSGLTTDTDSDTSNHAREGRCFSSEEGTFEPSSSAIRNRQTDASLTKEIPVAAAIEQPEMNELKKKRLMDKINKLSASTSLVAGGSVQTPSFLSSNQTNSFITQ